MTDPAERPTQVLGQAGEACAACGAPLAIDQRYCLNCGRRRGGPRVDYRRHLAGSQPGAEAAPGARNGQAPAAAAAAPEEKKPERDYTPLAAVGGIAVLGLMLLVGVLIGKENGSGSSTPAPVVLERGAESEAGESETTADTEAAKGRKPRKTASAATKPGKKADDASSLTAGDSGGGPVEASDKALEELEQSGDYSDQSAKLPDEIATGGAPPPEDDKAPGGGSKGTAIE